VAGVEGFVVLQDQPDQFLAVDQAQVGLALLEGAAGVAEAAEGDEEAELRWAEINGCGCCRALPLCFATAFRPDRPRRTMAIPTYDQFIEPLLRLLAQHPEGLHARIARERVAELLGLSEAEKAEMLPSGLQAIYQNRAGWAQDRLKRAGLAESPRRGIWKATQQGLDFVRAHAGSLGTDEVERLARGFIDVRLRPERNGEAVAAPTQAIASAAPALSSPEERLDQAIDEIRQSVIANVLEALGQVSPTFFERIVLDVLHRMGYGGGREDLQRVGGSGDGGIDGIISLDRLGFEKVYVQAKRWQSSVGAQELRAFYGALAGQRARKGVFITTSTFTVQASAFAASVEGLVLVDGQRLARLMVDYEVGVSARTVKVPRIDSDYFEEEAG
jgi:restriction system protein